MTISRFERKIVLPSKSTGFMVAWLRHHFAPDPIYPETFVTSLYLDTPELDSYQECLNGDVYKHKVRLRWYDRPENGQSLNAYIEVKSKRGFNTVKNRQLVTIPGTLINHYEIPQLVQTLKLEEILPGLGYLPGPKLHPVMLISYDRYRFIEPETGTSITYDLNITSRIFTPGVTSWGWGLTLESTVLEIKGTTLTLPQVFLTLHYKKLQWSTFSKYAKCLEAHLEKPGTESGIMIASRLDMAK